MKTCTDRMHRRLTYRALAFEKPGISPKKKQKAKQNRGKKKTKGNIVSFDRRSHLCYRDTGMYDLFREKAIRAHPVDFIKKRKRLFFHTRRTCSKHTDIYTTCSTSFIFNFLIYIIERWMIYVGGGRTVMKCREYFRGGAEIEIELLYIRAKRC